MNTPRNLKTIAGCATRVLVSITAPEETDTELTGYVNSAGTPLAAAVQGTAEEGEILFPPLPAGEHLYEIRLGGKAVAWGHLLARQTAFPTNPADVVDWELAADLTATDAAQISLSLLPGARGLTGESAYDAAVEGGYEGTEEEFAAMLAALPQDAANAAVSAADAAASQAAAAASEIAAEASATAAGNSASAAANSATTAATKATAAAYSAEDATARASDAVEAATAAANSAATAQDSANAAQVYAGNAQNSAAAAAGSATTAGAKAGEAANSATAAGNSASAAANSATTASAKAGEAANSATTAATKATTAAQSAQDAQDAAELLGDAALQGRNNTFTQTNTFNGGVALNGPVSGSHVLQKAEAGANDSVVSSGGVMQSIVNAFASAAVEGLLQIDKSVDGFALGPDGMPLYCVVHSAQSGTEADKVRSITGRSDIAPSVVFYTATTAPGNDSYLLSSALPLPEKITFVVENTSAVGHLFCLRSFGSGLNKEVEIIFRKGFASSYGYSMKNGAMQAETCRVNFGTMTTYPNKKLFTNSWSGVKNLHITAPACTHFDYILAGTAGVYIATLNTAQISMPALSSAKGFYFMKFSASSGMLALLHGLPAWEDGETHEVWLYADSITYAGVDAWLTELGISHTYSAGSPPVIADGQPLPNGWALKYTTDGTNFVN